MENKPKAVGDSNGSDYNPVLTGLNLFVPFVNFIFLNVLECNLFKYSEKTSLLPEYTLRVLRRIVAPCNKSTPLIPFFSNKIRPRSGISSTKKYKYSVNCSYLVSLISEFNLSSNIFSNSLTCRPILSL